MNKKGQTIIYAFMLGILFFFIGIGIAPSLQDVTHSAMGDSMLNCTTTIDSQTKAVCTSIDMFLPLFTGLIFGLAGLVIAGVAVR